MVNLQILILRTMEDLKNLMIQLQPQRQTQLLSQIQMLTLMTQILCQIQAPKTTKQIPILMKVAVVVAES